MVHTSIGARRGHLTPRQGGRRAEGGGCVTCVSHRAHVVHAESMWIPKWPWGGARARTLQFSGQPSVRMLLRSFKPHCELAFGERAKEYVFCYSCRRQAARKTAPLSAAVSRVTLILPSSELNSSSPSLGQRRCHAYGPSRLAVFGHGSTRAVCGYNHSSAVTTALKHLSRESNRADRENRASPGQLFET